MTSSNGNISRVTGPLCGEFTAHGEFPTQRPVTRSFDVFFELRLNKRLSKQLWGWWFETSSWSLWRQCNGKTLHWRQMSVKISEFPCSSIVCATFFFQVDIKEISKLRITGPFVRGIHWWSVPVTGGFPSQRTSNAKSLSISWRQTVAITFIDTEFLDRLWTINDTRDLKAVTTPQHSSPHVYRRFLVRKLSLKKEELCQPLG